MRRGFIVVSASAVALAVSLAGCMSEREAWLRSKDIAAKKSHPATYAPFVLKGKATFEEGSELVVTAPNMPYVPADIPNGAQIQANAINSALSTAGLVTLGAFGISKAGDSAKTVNNYAQPTEGGN